VERGKRVLLVEDCVAAVDDDVARPRDREMMTIEIQLFLQNRNHKLPTDDLPCLSSLALSPVPPLKENKPSTQTAQATQKS